MLWDCCPVCLSITLVYCGQTVGWIKMPLGTEVGLSPSDIVLVGDAAPLPHRKRHSSPHFSAHVYCGQTAGCSRIPLGTEVGLGPGDIIRWEPSSPMERGTAAPPLFNPCLLWPNGCPSLQLLNLVHKFH